MRIYFSPDATLQPCLLGRWWTAAGDERQRVDGWTAGATCINVNGRGDRAPPPHAPRPLLTPRNPPSCHSKSLKAGDPPPPPAPTPPYPAADPRDRMAPAVVGRRVRVPAALRPPSPRYASTSLALQYSNLPPPLHLK